KDLYLRRRGAALLAPHPAAPMAGGTGYFRRTRRADRRGSATADAGEFEGGPSRWLLRRRAVEFCSGSGARGMVRGGERGTGAGPSGKSVARAEGFCRAPRGGARAPDRRVARGVRFLRTGGKSRGRDSRAGPAGIRRRGARLTT